MVPCGTAQEAWRSSERHDGTDGSKSSKSIMVGKHRYPYFWNSAQEVRTTTAVEPLEAIYRLSDTHRSIEHLRIAMAAGSISNPNDLPAPYIIRTINLPSVCSFSSPKPPILTVTLLLCGSSFPITIRTRATSLVSPITSTVVIDPETGESRPPAGSTARWSERTLSFNRRNAVGFLTLFPDEPYVISTPFRDEYSEPFSRPYKQVLAEHVERLLVAKDSGIPGAYTRALKAYFRQRTPTRMHQLKIGKEYLIRSETDLVVGWWRYGAKGQLLELVDHGDPLPPFPNPRVLRVVNLNEVTFRVEA